MTDWIALIELTSELRVPARIKARGLDLPEHFDSLWCPSPSYIEGGGAGPLPFREIEFIEIDPVVTSHRGHLVAPQTMDQSAALEARLSALGCTWERVVGRFRIVRKADDPTLVLRHQDGPVHYRLQHGGFHVGDRLLSLWIECVAVDPGAFPQRFLFSLIGYPCPDATGELAIVLAGNLEGEVPNVYAYTTFHAQSVSAQLKVRWIQADLIELRLEVTSDDVTYYGKKAMPNTLVGHVQLPVCGLDEVWNPG